MAGVIQVGGLATGLDTNKIVDELVRLERRPIDLLEDRQAALEDSQAAFATFVARLSALQGAADALDTADEVLVGKASSSNQTAVTATAGSGASRGTVTLNVTQLARGSVAVGTAGVTAATDVVAGGAGVFKFQVGSGSVQTVDLTGTTTLQDLVNAINDLGAGVTASAVNLGTAADPDYRLSIASRATGASSTITVVQDDTALAVQTTQAGLNAEFTVSGFSDTFQRESNSFSDVLAGVTLTLQDEGSATVTVNDDATAIAANVGKLVTAFNDLVRYVNAQSEIARDTDTGDVSVGPLAANSTVRRLVDRLHETFSATLAGAAGQYVNLSSLGLATQKDGTIAFNAATFASALGDDAEAVAAVFAGNGTAAGIANDLSEVIGDATGAGGLLSADTTGFTDRIRDLQDEIDAGERRLALFEENLRLQFAALETLVAGLQSQGSYLVSALGRL